MVRPAFPWQGKAPRKGADEVESCPAGGRLFGRARGAYRPLSPHSLPNSALASLARYRLPQTTAPS